MPFAHAGSAVAVLLKHFRQGQLRRIERGRVEGVHDAVKLPPVKPPGEQRIAARRAYAGGTVRIREAHALRGKAVEVRRGNLRRRIVRAEVSVAHVVGVEDDDVGTCGVGSQSPAAERGEQEEPEEGAFHKASLATGPRLEQPKLRPDRESCDLLRPHRSLFNLTVTLYKGMFRS